MEPLVDVPPEPSYRPRGHPHAVTEIRLSGSESLFVREERSEIKSQLEATWAEVHLSEDGTRVQIRSSAVVALIDLAHSEQQLKAA